MAFPSVDLTNFDLAAATKSARRARNGAGSTAGELARESIYAAIGLGVLTVQRLQVRRRELEREHRR